MLAASYLSVFNKEGDFDEICKYVVLNDPENGVKEYFC